ncbi:MAG: hypothetical protein A3C80_00870 [Candidatus Ryanbacteria bacterium RIFCSPHIGHO2_02_FULL_45_43]|uniref:HTH deoR-type domain-containing protein n=1 Tax=Candidatus Ryanbacteria bacterium RIFCSPHIGHO2_01_45_13 TaxID=1802112 RepID=A0A1G2FZ39_9BACT|nr:MAG: hypothetical protein A2718_03980 [Candidatus Ryanbacteria bacterium RIFCSPHIGHO2_01_FULL_44_130]OGZ43345.1 MAG: hypothetical protein A2W41_04470 [Candidatus Ryanbacteria bacterium RIFCSPHIGHO2_01_45_13]OGZ48931.1 MAG: hypothetical protein A3C80_00870 [Candidatus Ryanbacteria bacterium RIFCSPHIGHO2_02_FULL_45_43]OGZ50900.1 MAG: hypothetical protein A3E55_02955 [Candidatus Ryanbacteria bacterium RIFCSPHIGHO2_12_FULL_44_20]OGZ51747.1 MAG: hypothetical protein A3A17_00055 [Candidatus Ryanba
MDEARLTRLTEALYRVTDLMSDQEPLKWSLRGKALFVLKLAWKGRSGAIFKSRVEVHERIASVISELLHLLEIASATAHISRINFEVLSREYQSVNGDIQAAKEQKAMFEGVNMVLADQKTHSELNETGAKNREEAMAQSAGREAVTDKKLLAQDSTKKEPMQETHAGYPEYVFPRMREKKIIQYLRTNRWASRRDLISIFEHDISEKTVQRDLAALVESGVLEKEGEKRWRKYTLKLQNKE